MCVATDECEIFAMNGKCVCLHTWKFATMMLMMPNGKCVTWKSGKQRNDEWRQNLSPVCLEIGKYLFFVATETWSLVAAAAAAGEVSTGENVLMLYPYESRSKRNIVYQRHLMERHELRFKLRERAKREKKLMNFIWKINTILHILFMLEDKMSHNQRWKNRHTYSFVEIRFFGVCTMLTKSTWGELWVNMEWFWWECLM